MMPIFGTVICCFISLSPLVACEKFLISVDYSQSKNFDYKLSTEVIAKPGEFDYYSLRIKK